MDLRQMQSIEKDMLDFVLSCSKEAGLQYILMGGTLLGAVRHRGFIPWDDDIDVGFVRNDYDQFLTILEQKLTNTPYALMTEFNEPQYGVAFAKLVDTRYSFHEKDIENQIVKNIFIDIFPYDRVPKRTLLQKIQYRQFQFWNVGILVRLGFNHPRSTFASVLLKLHQFVLLPFTTLFMKKRRLAALTKYKNLADSDVSNFSSRGFNKELVHLRDISEFTTTTFEGEKIQIPKGYDHILSHMYGDYMQLPPEADQIGRHVG